MATPAGQSRCDVSSQMTEAVQWEDWTEVVRLMDDGHLSELSQQQRRWVVDEVIERCHDPHCLVVLVTHCDDDMLEVIVRRMATPGMWSVVAETLQRGVSDARCRWETDEACQHASEEEIRDFILPRCADNQMDSVLTPLVERGLWSLVGVVLQRGVKDSQHRWAIDEACKHASEEEIADFMLPKCAKNQLNSVLTPLVERGFWGLVRTVLQRGVSDLQRRWAIQEACKHVSEQEIVDYILPRCTDDQLDSVLTPLVQRGLWDAAGTVLERGVGDSQRRWTIDEACKQAPAMDIEYWMLPRCADDQLDSVMTPLVQRGLWGAVGMVLERSALSDSQRRWAIDEACERASDDDLAFYILSHCDNSQQDSNLTRLVKRGLWHAVGTALQTAVSDSQRRWAVEEACKQAPDWIISFCVLPTCADNQLDSVLTPLVERGLWGAVGTVLQRGVSESQHIWAIAEACKRAPDEEVTDDILPHCNGVQLSSILTPPVERGLWSFVGQVLQRGVDDSQLGWIIDEACKRASDKEIRDYIIPCCADSHLDFVLPQLVERGMWGSVGRMLQRPLSDPQHSWAIDEACKLASDEEFRDYILPYCAHNQLDTVLTALVQRGLWSAVGSVLQRGVTESRHRWAIDQACNNAPERKVTEYILPHSTDDQLDSLLTPLVERGLWGAVVRVLERGVCDSQLKWAIENACKRTDSARIEKYFELFLNLGTLPPDIYDAVDSFLTSLITRGLWKAAATLLFLVVSETLCRWAVAEDNTEPEDAAFWNMVRNPWYGVRDLCGLCQFVRSRQLPRLNLSRRLRRLYGEVCEVLSHAILESVVEAWLCTQERNKDYTPIIDPSKLILQLHTVFSPRVRDLDPDSDDDVNCFLSRLLPCIHQLCEFSQTINYDDRTHPIFALHFCKFLIKHCYTERHHVLITEAVTVILATVPVVPNVQSVALGVLLRHGRWDVISHACLNHVWEHVRRQLFQAAVVQRRWSVVKLWADHSLYDDQRGWALEEAFREEQWDVFLLLADYGLTDSEATRVHYRLAKHADWDIVLQMFERGANVTDMKELLTGAKTRKAAHDKDDDLKRRQRASELRGLESDLKAKTAEMKTLKKAAKHGDWRAILFSIHRRPTEDHIRLALKAAVARCVWHVVEQLVKLGINAAQRDSLFTRMVKRRQWGVCMVLLEQGVNVERCLNALPGLVEMDQWTLVARVMMDYNVDDAVRRQVLQRAMERRQGSAVWQCVIPMHGYRLSVQEREKLFRQAFSRDVLQAIKPLIEGKDGAAIKRRNTVLPEAIQQHQWDVVDHCQLHRADIDMKDAEGDTPMHRAARKEDWEAVMALTKRGAHPSLLDKFGESVLYRAIKAEQWNAAKLLIQFHGDIHQAGRKGATSLQLLIDARQGEVIEHTLLWCPDQRKGVNEMEETALHAVCLSGWPNTAYYLVARGVNPLAVTRRGHSALSYAVLCKKCPQKMVAECIKLGVCRQQPQITDRNAADMRMFFSFVRGYKLWLTPALLAMMRGLPLVTRMLYESGSCSSTELFRLRTQLPEMIRSESGNGHSLREIYLDEIAIIFSNERRYSFEDPSRKSVQASFSYLMKVSATPRSLKSSCRLVISRCVEVRRQRQRKARYEKLPRLSQEMKNYVMFSDLTDPDFGRHETDVDEEHTDDNFDMNVHLEYSSDPRFFHVIIWW